MVTSLAPLARIGIGLRVSLWVTALPLDEMCLADVIAQCALAPIPNSMEVVALEGCLFVSFCKQLSRAPDTFSSASVRLRLRLLSY